MDTDKSYISDPLHSKKEIKSLKKKKILYF